MENRQKIQDRSLTVSGYPRQENIISTAVFPYIRLSGKWLEEIGFTIGQCIKVIILPNNISLIVPHFGQRIIVKVERHLQCRLRTTSNLQLLKNNKGLSAN